MNLLQQIFDSPQTAKLGLVLLHSLWQIILVGVVVKLTLGWFGERGTRKSTIRYSVAYLGLIAVCVLPTLTWITMETPAPIPVSSTTTSRQTSQPQQSSLDYELSRAQVAIQTPITPVSSEPAFATTFDQVAQSQSPSYPLFSSWIVCGWLFGMMLFAIRPLIGLRSASLLKNRGQQEINDRVEQTVRRLKERLGIIRSISIFQSALVSVPTVVGIIRPTILLPISCLTNLTADELDSILLHELAHIRRHDQLANLFQIAVETIFFFHPLVWWISRVVRNERENCCDDIAVEACGNSKSLVSALLSLEQSRGETFGNLAGVMTSNGGSLVSRVKRLVEPDASHRSPFHSVASLVVVTIVVSSALASSTLFADSDSLSGKADLGTLSGLEIVELQINKSLEGRYARVELENLNQELYSWDSVQSNDPRLVHRLWNITTPELRNQAGRRVEGWKPDLLLHFVQPKDGISPKTITIQVKLTDRFQWSIGNGVWDMPSQWPMRSSISAIASADSKDTEANEHVDSETTLEHESRERLFNEAAYERSKDSIRENHRSRWVAIVDGRILASYDSFNKCVEAAGEANNHASHRFIFRAGIDDIAAEFIYSPWLTGNPSWWQFGIQFRNDHKISISGERWGANGKVVQTNEGKATVGFSAPGQTKATLQRPVGASGLVEQQLTITSSDVEQMNLRRFSIPGVAKCLTYEAEFDRVHVQVLIPALGISEQVAAFVAPSEIVAKDPPKANSSASLFSPPIVSIARSDGAESKENAMQEMDDKRKIMELLTAETPAPNEQLQQSWQEIHNEQLSLTATIKVLKEKLGGNHPDVLAANEALERLLERKQGVAIRIRRSSRDSKIKQEILVQREALKSLENQFGPEHPSVKTIEKAIDALIESQADPEAHDLDSPSEGTAERTPRTAGKAPSESVMTKLIELTLQLEEAKTKYGSDHQSIVLLQNQIDVLYQLLTDTLERNQEQVPVPQDPTESLFNSVQLKIKQLELKKAQLLEKHGPNHPDVLMMERQIELWKQYLRENKPASKKKDPPSDVSVVFLEVKVKQLKEQLAKAKETHGIDAPMVLALNEELKFHEKQLREHQSRDQGKHKQDTTKSEKHEPATWKKLLQLESQLAELKLRYSPTHPKIIAIQRQVELLKHFSKQRLLEQQERERRWPTLHQGSSKAWKNAVDVPLSKVPRR